MSELLGSVVKLKSGGPEMTIIEARSYAYGVIVPQDACRFGGKFYEKFILEYFSLRLDDFVRREYKYLDGFIFVDEE